MTNEQLDAILGALGDKLITLNDELIWRRMSVERLEKELEEAKAEK